MAEYSIKYKEDGSIQHRITFMGEVFVNNQRYGGFGRGSGANISDYVELDGYGCLEDDVMDVLYSIVEADDEEVIEILGVLGRYEEKHLNHG